MTNKALVDGDFLPQFELLSTSLNVVTNKQISGKNTLLFIYPKDDTASCTKEVKDFSNCKQSFINLNLGLYGISKDNIASHKKFMLKHSLQVELLSDETISFIKAIGSWVEKSMYGKKYLGVERTSLLISKNNKIIKIWRKVKVPGHVQEVLNFAEKNVT